MAVDRLLHPLVYWQLDLSRLTTGGDRSGFISLDAPLLVPSSCRPRSMPNCSRLGRPPLRRMFRRKRQLRRLPIYSSSIRRLADCILFLSCTFHSTRQLQGIFQEQTSKTPYDLLVAIECMYRKQKTISTFYFLVQRFPCTKLKGCVFSTQSQMGGRRKGR
jgi:hypothetical protein